MQSQVVAHIGESKTSGGFTLIEVLIAISIFAIGILAIAGMQIKSINLNSAARMQSEATNAAVDFAECISCVRM